jgi:hypothetical protein
VLRKADHVLAPDETARTLIASVVERNVTVLGGRAAKRARRAAAGTQYGILRNHCAWLDRTRT